MNGFFQTIRFKILLAMAVCFVLMAAISVFSLSAISRLKSNVTSSYSGVTVPIVDLANFRAAQLRIRLKLRRIQVFHDPAMTKQTTDALHADFDAMNSAWTDYYPGRVSAADEKAVADKVQDALPQLKQLTDQASDLLLAGNYDGATKAVNDQAALSDTLLALVGDDLKINVDQAKQFNADSESTANTALMIAIGLVAAGLVVMAGTAVFLLRAIGVPLNRAIGVANEIAAGNLDNRIVLDVKGEFGQLLQALDTMDRQITQTVRGIQTSTESVTVASREIAAGNMDLSARTEEQAASLEETAASMTQLTETVKQNADNARQASSLATGATGLADTGDDAVRAMVGTIEQISGSSSKISEITGVIEGIAFQTNILALNAAVEAARAGEQGRGFAVVASEVRSLAQRSASAAKEIKELITSSVAIIDGGTRQAAGVGETMGQVKQAIKRVSDIVNEIAAASEEQSRGIEQVNQAVSQMDEVTQQNAALVEQAAAAAQSLEEQAGNLKQATSVFRLGQGGARAVSTGWAAELRHAPMLVEAGA
ncbi:methyl-accepting chemotaxis protein [Paraburkholderia bryophila]|jgi:methyl-accepting chemotaxis protein|uniref:Methyl-accepting chemotaxis protein n=1 Tax=Paraburkholderia bryophila TaxID=420952 RepID=A0A329CI92_9BURK|nr:methyl-accepting chemotaxis protein [Paraburkholderia bryophila]RAS34593.1 methyl-accepting chemotaxis protein [Paraburkholderia bryophila]